MLGIKLSSLSVYAPPAVEVSVAQSVTLTGGPAANGPGISNRASKGARRVILSRGTVLDRSRNRGRGSQLGRRKPLQVRAASTTSMEEIGLQGDTVLNAETLFSTLPGFQAGKGGDAAEGFLKVTVVGVGNVGMACVQTILTQNIADEIALVDVQPDKLRGEMLDLQHAAGFLPNVKIVADTDYSISAGSDVCIITAGARQREGEDRLSLVERNVAVFKNIVPQLARHSPNAILLVVSNPVDVLSWVTWKLSGFPPNRVIGSGTNLDTSRFRSLIANFFKVSAQNVYAQILGEHGDTSVPLWSSVNVAGVPLYDFLESRGIQAGAEVRHQTHKAVVDGAYEVIKLKGYTSWAIGYSVAALASSLLRNQRHVHPVSVLAQGFHGIEQDVYLSLPAILGRSGVQAVANSVLNDEEVARLRLSAKTLYAVQQSLTL